ncbi:MAG: TetR/AcrR family transcriptional regulator [Ilumatobacter sp.]|uniref:TetR/AcrR family transcriptional regulator n=1 Tax=Ilumatobacter sp. TaxID=1967498 RepID=UPI003298C90A
MRSDARQNRKRILDATAGLVLEVGGEPSRDAVAERAAVGIGTVYRHFPDRQSLLHATARHVLVRTIEAGESIVSDVDSADALGEYMHAAIDNGIGVVNILHPLLDDTDWPDLQARAGSLMTALIERNRRDHPDRTDLSVGDIAFATIRFGRPLAIGLPPDEDRAIAHGQLARYIDGLHSRIDTTTRTATRATTRTPPLRRPGEQTPT